MISFIITGISFTYEQDILLSPYDFFVNLVITAKLLKNMFPIFNKLKISKTKKKVVDMFSKHKNYF